jgi:hypothetical protein
MLKSRSAQIQDLLGQTAGASARQRTPSPDAVHSRNSRSGSWVQEVYKRPGGTFGYRYVVWFSQRDAGGELRGHAWRVLDGLDAVVVDTAEAAKIQADHDADLNGMDFHDPWRGPT